MVPGQYPSKRVQKTTSQQKEAGCSDMSPVIPTMRGGIKEENHGLGQPG
jgi:hypothetical protein